jgi:hypothetical protein
MYHAVLEVVDFTKENHEYTVGFWPLGFCFLLAGIIFITAMILDLTVFKDKNITQLMITIASSGIFFLVAVPLLVVAIIHGFGPSDEPNNAKQISSVQKWVSQNYLIDLTKKEATTLIDNQVDLDAKNVTTDKGFIIVDNEYGDTVKILLVESNDEWKLLQDTLESNPAS